MNNLDGGFHFIYEKFISSQNIIECDVFRRLYDITKHEIVKLYPNCLVSNNLILMQVSHAGFSKEFYTYDELFNGSCRLESEFLSNNSIEVLGNDIDTHYSAMSRAFFISGVFRNIPDSFNVFQKLPDPTANLSNIFDSNSIQTKPFQTSENSSNNEVSSGNDSFGLNSFPMPTVPLNGDLNLNSENILCPSVFNDMNCKPDYCIPKSGLFSKNIESFSETTFPNISEAISTPEKFKKVNRDQQDSTRLPQPDPLEKDQIQYISQNWMAIVCCYISDILLSLYHNILVDFLKLDSILSDVQQELLIQVKSSSFIKKISFGKIINMTINPHQLSILNSYFDNTDPCYMTISSRMNNMVLDVSGGKKDKGTKVHVWPLNRTNAQKWRLTHDCRLESGVESGMYLDIKEQKHSKGATCCISDLSESKTQKWFYSLDGSIVSQSNENILDIRGSNKNKGTDVILWPNWGGDNQKWDINDFD